MKKYCICLAADSGSERINAIRREELPAEAAGIFGLEQKTAHQRADMLEAICADRARKECAEEVAAGAEFPRLAVWWYSD